VSEALYDDTNNSQDWESNRDHPSESSSLTTHSRARSTSVMTSEHEREKEIQKYLERDINKGKDCGKVNFSLQSNAKDVKPEYTRKRLK